MTRPSPSPTQDRLGRPGGSGDPGTRVPVRYSSIALLPDGGGGRGGELPARGLRRNVQEA